MPTATRTLITAAYPPEQELGRTGELIGIVVQSVIALTPEIQPTATPTPIPFHGLDVQIISVTTQPGLITTRLRLYNGGNLPIQLAPDDIWLAHGYVENPPGPRVPSEGMAAFDLLPGQAADMALVWVWSGEPYGIIGVGGYQFALELL